MFILLFRFWGAIRLSKTWETTSAISGKQQNSAVCVDASNRFLQPPLKQTLFFYFLCLTPTLLYLLLCASAVWLNRDTSFGYSVGFCRCGIQQKSCVCVCARVCGAVITLVVRLRYNDLSPRVSQWQVLAFLYWVASNNKPASIHPSHLASTLCLYRPT